MPIRHTITKSWETKGILRARKHKREYHVTYTDDSDERSDAVGFFGKGLSPALNLPDSIDQMSERAAQEYLDAHPFQRQWSMLTLDQSVTFADDDLHRLRHLPELERIHSHAAHLTDSGVSFMAQVLDLRHLLIYSPLITDRCLEDIVRLRHLLTIDLQGSHLISRKAFDVLVSRLPNLVDIYPPFDRPLSQIFSEIEQRSKKNTEQDGTGQPATRSESKSEGSDKPQPKSEGRSR